MCSAKMAPANVAENLLRELWDSEHMPKAREKTIFVCDSCGNEAVKWEGRCPTCGGWNTLAEFRQANGGQRRSLTTSPQAVAVQLADVSTDDFPRMTTSSDEFNRVLGGGIVPGSIILVAGDPGIGKSTILLRLAGDVANAGNRVLYVSGEESASQIRLRADRLGVDGKDLYVLPATDVDDVLSQLDSEPFGLAVVDSIQTLYDREVSSEPGSVTQIRECARKLLDWAKARNVPVILTGHVTKGGDIAGPRVLEHMVDVVLYMEGDPVSSWRLLRSVKNRFGSTNEVGVFEMTGNGLQDVLDPSRSLLAERADGAIGSAVTPILEGSRTLLVEVQALTNPSVLPNPRRVATGIDHNRLLLVCAVLNRRAGIPLSNQDVIVNVTGGLKISEPAADLAVALAIASSFRNEPVDPGLAAVGELGLTGEVRLIPQLERRLQEASRLGFQRCLHAGEALGQNGGSHALEPISVAHIRQAIGLGLKTPAKVSGQSFDIQEN